MHSTTDSKQLVFEQAAQRDFTDGGLGTRRADAAATTSWVSGKLLRLLRLTGLLVVVICLSDCGCSKKPAAAMTETVFRQRSNGELLRVSGSAADQVDPSVYERVLYSPAAKKWFPAPSKEAMERMPLGPVCPETGVPLVTTDTSAGDPPANTGSG